MRRLELHPPPPPPLEEVPFKSLYRKETYDARTGDGWVLQLTRYRPLPQPWHQPILDEPLLLVHGWSQNRHAFSCGDFVKHLLWQGADVHLLELRGHGKSSRELQVHRAALDGRLPPADLDWGWDLDSYLLEDLPAGVEAVKQRTGRKTIFYVGNSMGGMLGYGYAAQHQDLAGLITLGAPSHIGRGFPLLQAGALLGPKLLGPLVDLGFHAARGAEHARHGAADLLRKPRWLRRAGDALAHPESAPRDLRFRHLPIDRALQLLAHLATERNLALLGDAQAIARRLGSLLNPDRAAPDDIRWLLRRGGEKEPRRVVEQFARWIRHDEMVCYRTGFDYRKSFPRIQVPLAVLYGEHDKIGSERSTRGVAALAGSEYRVWRAVRENSHLELTIGADVHHSCLVISELIRYARAHERLRSPAPRREPGPALRLAGAGPVLA